MKTTEQVITLQIKVPEIDGEDFRDQQDQVQLNVYFAAHGVKELLDHVIEMSGASHWPKGFLRDAATILLNIDAVHASFLDGHFDKALAQTHVARWQLLSMPPRGGKRAPQELTPRGVPSEQEIGEHLGYDQPD